jgi:ascorbate-specific PTS system EIIC-type component UlaA
LALVHLNFGLNLSPKVWHMTGFVIFFSPANQMLEQCIKGRYHSGSLHSIIHSHPLKSVVDKIWFKYRKVLFYAIFFVCNFAFFLICVMIFSWTGWRTWFVAAHVLCWGLAESDSSVTLSVTCVDWLHWWYIHAADIVPLSTALTSVTNMSEKCKSTSPSKKWAKDNRYWREIRRNKPTWKR